MCLIDWIYENIPLFLDDKEDLYQGLIALAKADIYENRARKSNYRLQKYMYLMMSGGVALSRTKSEGNGIKKQIFTISSKQGFPQSAFSLNETANGLMIRPLKYLGDDWRKLNDAFRDIGGNYIRGTGSWLIPYIRSPQLKWRYIRTYHNRLKLKSIASKIALKCHVSTKEAINEVIPLLKIIFKNNKESAATTSAWLELEESEKDWLLK